MKMWAIVSIQAPLCSCPLFQFEKVIFNSKAANQQWQVDLAS